jgi:hydroxylaminobenzene mutase
MSPILAAGRSAQAWQERLVTIGFMSVGLAMVASSVIILYGLRRTAK